jgi:hypothetical protein
MIPNKKRKEHNALQDLEDALRAVLRKSGDLFPETLADVQNILERVDISKVPSPDLNKFRVLLRSRQSIQVPRLPEVARRPEEDVVAELRAARNGNEISAETLERMRADREAAERKQLA